MTYFPLTIAYSIDWWYRNTAKYEDGLEQDGYICL